MSAASCPSIREVRDALGRGAASADGLIDAQRRRLLAEAPRLNCVVQPAPPAPSAPGLLHGVALAHKDVFDQPGRAAGLGRPDADRAAGAPARVLQRLASAGAVNLAALTLAEWCCGATADNRHHGRPLNPLDPDAMVGGSSGGSAVAVAAGLCAASLGTDTAGSVRIPAASCGLVGLKPGHGRVDLTGVAALAPSLDTVGILARTASDAAHVWEALMAPDAEPPAATRSDAVQAALDAQQPWRLGVAVRREEVHAAIWPALDATLRRLAQAWRTEDRRVLDLQRLAALATIVLHAEGAATFLPQIQADPDGLSPAAQALLLPGVAMPATWYARALASRAEACRAFLNGPMDGVDFLVTPALPLPLPDWAAVTPGDTRFDPSVLASLHRHFGFVNYLGLPAVVLPVGHDLRGRPVSLQAIGRPGTEAALLAFAHQAATLGAARPFC